MSAITFEAVAGRNIEGAYYFKTPGNPDATNPVRHRKTYHHGVNIYPIQLQQLISNPLEWTDAPVPAGWPVKKHWPPPQPHIDLLRATQHDEGNLRCITCREDDCSCSIEDFRSSRANWAFNLDLRSLNAGGQGCGLFAHRAFRSGTPVGELTGVMRPYNPSTAPYKAQLMIRFKLDSAAGVPLPARYSVCLDMSEQCGPLAFANHSCNPNLKYEACRVGASLCLMLKTTRLVQAHEEFTFDWRRRRYGRECRSSPDECTCGAEQ
ncbi:hypothetical protein BKA63DRAFT_134705 [Paraphoma chrysanthemicola]|nr:hypothetical protein BKA63DRAFT_134705 [Paraphoma chrysanthemicola]